jgi:hypothetical protein
MRKWKQHFSTIEIDKIKFADHTSIHVQTKVALLYHHEKTATGFSSYVPDLPRCVFPGSDEVELQNNVCESVSIPRFKGAWLVLVESHYDG